MKSSLQISTIEGVSGFFVNIFSGFVTEYSQSLSMTGEILKESGPDYGALCRNWLGEASMGDPDVAAQAKRGGGESPKDCLAGSGKAGADSISRELCGSILRDLSSGDCGVVARPPLKDQDDILWPTASRANVPLEDIEKYEHHLMGSGDNPQCLSMKHLTGRDAARGFGADHLSFRASTAQCFDPQAMVGNPPKGGRSVWLYIADLTKLKRFITFNMLKYCKLA